MEFLKRHTGFTGAMLGFAMFAATTTHAARQRNFFSASRALAMGDAYTAYNVGYESIYYNPAGVAMRSEPKFKLFDLEATGSQALVLIFKDTFSNLLNFPGLTQSMAAHPDKPIVVGLSLLPQFIVKNFSVGLLLRGQSESTISSTTHDMDMYAFADIGGYIHYGAALFGGILKIGAGVKLLDRSEVDKVYTQAQYAGGLQFPNQWNEGTAVGFDVGALVTLPTQFLPTFGLAVQDVGGTKFRANKVFLASASAPNQAPSTMSQKVNFGYAMKVRHGHEIASGFSFEMKDILAPVSTKSYLDRFHAGWELNVKNSFYLRGGVNQGYYWTAGVGIGVGDVRLELASYGENISSVAGTRVSDRKWVGRYVAQF